MNGSINALICERKQRGSRALQSEWTHSRVCWTKCDGAACERLMEWEGKLKMKLQELKLRHAGVTQLSLPDWKEVENVPNGGAKEEVPE